MIQPVGHLDFYVNGGRQQPGCNLVDIPLDAITDDMITSIRELGACNHLRSIEFFIDSLLPNMQYVGYECVVISHCRVNVLRVALITLNVLLLACNRFNIR